MDIFNMLNQVWKSWKCNATAFEFTDVQHEDGHFGQWLLILFGLVKLSPKWQYFFINNTNRNFTLLYFTEDALNNLKYIL